ncbi:MAG: hypothetical protein HOQ26_11275, partial [Gemmatimonadaceae bacterium]|nr:hypothetical protein [Gemmatimonadaceae bacterium]
MLRIFGWAAVAAMISANGGTPWPSIEESHVIAEAHESAAAPAASAV